MNKGELTVRQMWENFVTGTGPEKVEFRDGTIWAEGMAEAPGINALRRMAIYQVANGQSANVAQKGFDFGLAKLALGGTNAVRQFVGGYEASVSGSLEALTFTIINDVHYKSYSSSYLFGNGPDYPRSTRREMGTISMRISWTEKLR